MGNVTDVATGLRVPSQIPLDSKTHSFSEEILSDLGPGNNLAYTYYDGLVVTCNEEKTKWIWREANDGEIGLLGSNFTYPANWIVFGKNYSLLSFNFFKLQLVEEKLNKGDYEGNATDLDNRLIELENITFPDAVLKFGKVVVTDGIAFIEADDFNWRLNQVSFLNTPEYSFPINEADDGFYKSVLIVGDDTGNYHFVDGDQNEIAAPEPEVPEGMIKLALIPVFGAIIGEPSVLPNYYDQFLKRYKTTYKTSQLYFNLEPAEDDYNVIFNGTTNSTIRIFLNGHNGRYIKNGAIYPFKNTGTGIISVFAAEGVSLNAPNGLVLNRNQQCYIIKDDYNEWTLVNPVSKDDLDTVSSNKVDKVTGKGLSTEDYTPSEKNKLASIDATHYLAPLQTTVQLSALPQAGISDKARVYVENDLSDYFYDSTASSGDIAPDDQVGGIGFWRKVAVGGETAASIKTKYESNADTNAFTDAEKSLVATISGKEDASNKSQDIEADKTSTAKYASVKQLYDWAVAKFQAALVSGTNIKTINGSSILGSGDLSVGSSETATTLGALIGSSADATPNDSDFIATSLTAGGILKKITWTNAKAFLKTYFDTLYKTDTISYALSDTSTALATGDTDPFQAPYNFTLVSYWIGVKTAPTVSSLIVDLKKNGTSITSTKAGIDATEKTSLTGTSPVLTTTTFAKGDEITPNIYQVGSSETGRSLKLYLEIIKT